MNLPIEIVDELSDIQRCLEDGAYWHKPELIDALRKRMARTAAHLKDYT